MQSIDSDIKKRDRTTFPGFTQERKNTNTINTLLELAYSSYVILTDDPIMWRHDASQEPIMELLIHSKKKW